MLVKRVIQRLHICALQYNVHNCKLRNNLVYGPLDQLIQLFLDNFVSLYRKDSIAWCILNQLYTHISASSTGTVVSSIYNACMM